VDKGSFRAITVGFDVGQRVDAATPGVMRLLSEVPAREARDYPALPPDTEAGLQGAANAPARGGPGAAVPAGAMAREGGKASGREGPGAKPPLAGVAGVAGVAGGVLLALFLAGAAIRVVQLRLRRRKDQEDK
jgi:hypothetical protein